MAGIAQPADEHPGAVVIQLPVAQRSCFTCVHARFPERNGGAVTFCTVYDEDVDSEAYAAEDCFTYERCNEGDQPSDGLGEHEPEGELE